jgi:hypothetical protein
MSDFEQEFEALKQAEISKFHETSTNDDDDDCVEADVLDEIDKELSRRKRSEMVALSQHVINAVLKIAVRPKTRVASALSYFWSITDNNFHVWPTPTNNNFDVYPTAIPRDNWGGEIAFVYSKHYPNTWIARCKLRALRGYEWCDTGNYLTNVKENQNMIVQQSPFFWPSLSYFVEPQEKTLYVAKTNGKWYFMYWNTTPDSVDCEGECRHGCGACQNRPMIYNTPCPNRNGCPPKAIKTTQAYKDKMLDSKGNFKLYFEKYKQPKKETQKHLYPRLSFDGNESKPFVLMRDNELAENYSINEVVQEINVPISTLRKCRKAPFRWFNLRGKQVE